jgi:hypothetical protein
MMAKILELNSKNIERLEILKKRCKRLTTKKAMNFTVFHLHSAQLFPIFASTSILSSNYSSNGFSIKFFTISRADSAFS